MEKETTTEVSTVTTTTELIPIDPITILVLPEIVDKSYLQNGDGTQISVLIEAPTSNYFEFAKYALVNGILFIFGGTSDPRKIARLDDCKMTELSARLNEDRVYDHEAVSMNNGTLALLCFNPRGYNTCETFDGTTALRTFSSTFSHGLGGLGLYQSQAVSVGCAYGEHKKAEAFSSMGWSTLPDFPEIISGHSIIGLDNGSLLIFGGYIKGIPYSNDLIWLLKDHQWKKVAELKQGADSGSAIYSGRSVYFFAGQSYPNDNYPIQRIDLSEDENVRRIELIGYQQGYYMFPILYESSANYCA